MAFLFPRRTYRSFNPKKLTIPGELRGYRMWSIDFRNYPFLDYTGYLMSAGWSEYIWTSGQNLATCVKNCGHDVPHLGCTCGLYAFYEIDPIKRADFHAIGVIAASGRILLSQVGFRAQQARILAISIPPFIKNCDGFSAEMYQATYPDAKMYLNGYEEMLLDFPPDDISGLLND